MEHAENWVQSRRRPNTPCSRRRRTNFVPDEALLGGAFTAEAHRIGQARGTKAPF
jgi:hypothetical protein